MTHMLPLASITTPDGSPNCALMTGGSVVVVVVLGVTGGAKAAPQTSSLHDIVGSLQPADLMDTSAPNGAVKPRSSTYTVKQHPVLGSHVSPVRMYPSKSSPCRSWRT